MSEPLSQEPREAEAESGVAGLAGLRAELDEVDRAILAALNRRAALAQEVGLRKRAAGVGVYRPARERDLVAALAAQNPGPFPSAALPAVFREIISATRGLESRLRIAYLGPAGTFSHLAAREAFGSQAEYRPAESIPEALAALSRGEAEHAVVPVENSSEGVVTQTLDALLEDAPPLCGERLLRISHHLLSQARELAEVQRVASHPQPLAQCRNWLARHLPGRALIETASTAAAAELARRDGAVAAIGAALLAQSGDGGDCGNAGEPGSLRNLQVLARSIEDRSDNTTRFLVLGGEAPEASGADLTSVAYTVRRGEAGALHKLLEPFAKARVNLAAIHARPMRGRPWEYVFFLDLEGHQSEPHLQRACQEAAALSSSHRLLGSFPRAARPARASQASRANRAGEG